jgi:hypothetical protein
MADIQHTVIADPYIHEPKGIAAAAAGTVYVANSGVSGDWVNVPSAASNIVIVNEKADLPTPSGGFITLAASTGYQLVGNIDITTDRIKPSLNSHVFGTNRFTDGLSYSGSGAMFTATATWLLSNLNLSAPAGSIFDCTGVGAEGFVGTDCFVSSCASIGTMTDWRSTTFNSFSVLNASLSGLLWAGTLCSGVFMNNSLWNNITGVATDLGTATFDRLSLGPTNRWDTPVGGTAISGMTASQNINAGGHALIQGNIFNGLGAPIAGITDHDLQWEFVGNIGTPKTRRDAQGHIESNATATTFAGIGAVNAVPVNFGAAYVADLEEQFTISTAGKYTHLGLEERLFLADCTLFSEVTGGATRQYVYSFYKNGVEISSSRAKAEYDGSNPGAGSVSSIITLDTNDYLELYVFAVGTATDLTVETASIKLLGV